MNAINFHLPLLEFTRVTLILAALMVALHPSQASDFNHEHEGLTKVLRTHVNSGLVDYVSLKKNPADLNAYLAALAAVKKAEFDQWTKTEQMTYLLNLYNATTLRMIIDHYPLKSIKDIGWLLKGPWDQEVVRLFGETTTLATVEHKMLRKDYQEPRVHFALVCAAKGCPPLLNQAYTARGLEEQLEAQGKHFLRDASKNRVDLKSNTLYLSPIFKWFDDDFEKKSGTVQKFVAPYFTEEDGKALLQGKFRIRYTDYDWSLNDGSKAKR